MARKLAALALALFVAAACASCARADVGAKPTDPPEPMQFGGTCDPAQQEAILAQLPACDNWCVSRNAACSAAGVPLITCDRCFAEAVDLGLGQYCEPKTDWCAVPPE